MTIGVSHRIEQLADREEGFILSGAKPYESLVPLPEVIAASLGCSLASKKVQVQYQEMLSKLGAEFPVLRTIPLEDIRHAAGCRIAEGIRRLREGKVERLPGFDGEYGTIKLFEKSEIDNVDGQLDLFPGMDLSDEKEARPSFVEQSAESKQDEKEMNESIEVHENQEQELAVTERARAIAVIAGPGTGKTRTLIERIRYLVEVRGVKPSEITAVTFTNKAADEMRERIAKLGGKKRAANAMNIGTFHAICLELLQKHGIEFMLADEAQTMELAEYTVREFGLKVKAKELLRNISLQKAGVFQSEVEPQVYEYYQEQLRSRGVLDFDDLLIETLQILRTEEKNKIRKKQFSFLLVDEYQDISPIQYELICAWNADGKELFVIGDPDQSIYGFRGSDARCFEYLKDAYPDIKVIRLMKNYRSTPQILEGACALISHNPGEVRKLEPVQKSGYPIRLVTAQSEMTEAIFVAKEINRLIGGIDMLDVQAHAEHGVRQCRSFADIAVLYRTHYQAKILEKCLQKEGIPYIVAGRDDFLAEKSVRGSICFFRYLMDSKDSLSRGICLKLLWDLPENCVSDQVLEVLEEKYRPLVKKEKPQTVLQMWIQDLEFEKNHAMQKFSEMSVFYKRMSEFLEALALGTEGDLRRCGGKDYTADAVRLMTLHGSKGLEFPTVILCGVKKGIIPLESERHPTDMEEERRLFYVGMTRAKEELILTSVGDESAFLLELPEDIMCREEAGKQKKIVQAEQLNLFDFM